jgi:hypothetical protein
MPNNLGHFATFNSSRTWVRLFPIVFFFCYLNLTVILFMVGPWDFPTESTFKLYMFLALAHLALLFGYLSAAFKEPTAYCGKWSLSRLIVISIVVNIALLMPTSRFRTGSYIPNVVVGLTDPGGAYAQSLALREDGLPLVEYVRIVFGPFLFMALPLTVFYWNKLSVWMRIGGVFSMLGTVALFIAMGTNKAIADTVLLVPCLLFAAYCAGRIQIRGKRLIAVMAASILALVLFLGYFGFAVSSRDGSMVSAGYFAATHTQVDQDNFLLRHLSPVTANILIGLDLYLTHGYYALYLSLEEPFVPMFGVGNSSFLYRQAARISGDNNILEMPYPVRIEKYGWDSQLLWSSIYPWIASDVSFPGTIVIVFLIGRLFAQSWLDTLRGDNPFAVIMFSILLIVLFYFPANNQMLAPGEGVTALLGTLILWRRSRRPLHARRPHPRRAPAIA